MNDLQAVLLGLIQGFTEFLPVSSSGHLVVFRELMGLEQSLLVVVALHAATLISVLIFYRHRVWALVGGMARGDRASWQYVAKLVLATVPVVALVLLVGDRLDEPLRSPRVAGLGFLLTGALLWTTRRTLGAAHGGEPGWAAAWWIGCAQALAILPGVSRSGSTVAAALALGVAPAAAAEFSFLMSAVAIAGASVRELARMGDAGLLVSPGALTLGALAAFGSGLAAIWLFVRVLRTRHFYRFAFYVWALGGAFLAWLVF
jgi:undecaprenyl-diphosphatase